jgi:hypothetical protein
MFCFSQKRFVKDLKTTMLDSITYDLTSKTIAPAGIHLPFNGFEIIDARFDTTKIGFEIFRNSKSVITHKNFKRVKLEGGVQKAIEIFYNDYYKLCLKNNDNKLVIVLKTLWIDNTPSPEYNQKRNYKLVNDAYQNIHVKFEYYLKKDDAYFPLKRTDTIYQLTEQNISSSEIKFEKNNLSYFMFTIKSLIEKHDFDYLISKINYDKKLTLDKIDSFNNKRFLLPILTATYFKNGIFKNFAEFCNNSPSITNYELKKYGGPQLSDKDSTLEECFIFSKDSSLYINWSTKNEVFKTGNTFEFFTFSKVYLSKTFAGNLLKTLRIVPYKIATNSNSYKDNSIISGNGFKFKYVLIPRQINMDTGEIY